MLYAAIDIHKHAFQAAVLDPESGQVVEQRFAADRESVARWAERWRGRVAAVAIEATTGWRWVWRELAAEGFEVRLAEPVQTRAHARTASRTSAETERSCDSAIRKRSRTCDFGSRAESFECSSLFRTMVRCSAMGASVFLARPATRAP